MEDPTFAWSESDTVKMPAACPQCGEEHEAEVFTVVNAEQDPEAAERLRNGELFLTECPSCKSTFAASAGCLFEDPAAGLSLYLVQGDDMALDVAELFDEQVQNPEPGGPRVWRIVTDRTALAEKARIFATGLDDRPIELLKTDVYAQAADEDLLTKKGRAWIVFAGEQDGALLFDLRAGRKTLRCGMPREAYDWYENAVERSSLADGVFFAVDRGWANQALKTLEQEGIS